LFLEEGYYFLDEDDAKKNRREPVYQYIDQEYIGKPIEVTEERYEDIIDFVEFVYTKDQYPEMFL
jgi:hypothetical protein